jgi:hypothetical protein
MRLRVLAALLFCSVAFAVGLSSAPQLHDWLHKVGDRSKHECAATLISSGSVEHSACEPASVAPQAAPSVPAFRTQIFPRVLAYLGFSRLEHAPPALS